MSSLGSSFLFLLAIGDSLDVEGLLPMIDSFLSLSFEDGKKFDDLSGGPSCADISGLITFCLCLFFALSLFQSRVITT